jgi:hypothetical protein
MGKNADGGTIRSTLACMHACMHAGLLCASLLSLGPETLHGRTFGNRDGSIHIFKDGTLDALLQFQSLTYVIVEY